MATYPTVDINYNARDNTVAPSYIPSAFIVGVSQRGPCYRVVTITDVNQFLDVFGQPTNKFEYDFFKAVKTTVFSRSIAYCYRIPYSDEEKHLYDAKFKYVLKQTADNLTQLQYDISSTTELSDIVDGKEAVFEFTPINDFESIIEIENKENDDTNGNRNNSSSGNGNQSISNNTNLSSWIGDENGSGSSALRGSIVTIYNETIESLNHKCDTNNTRITAKFDRIYNSPNPTGIMPNFPENPIEYDTFDPDGFTTEDGYYLNGRDIVLEKGFIHLGEDEFPCFRTSIIDTYQYAAIDGEPARWVPHLIDCCIYRAFFDRPWDGSRIYEWRIATMKWNSYYLSDIISLNASDGGDDSGGDDGEDDKDEGDDEDSSRTISISDNRLRSISNDIDPEYVVGIFPIFFGAKDAENLYDLKFSDLFYYDKTDITRNQNYIDKFNIYVCDKDNSQYLVDSVEITELFKEFERSNHFTYDWFQVEIGKLIDNLAPKDTDEFRNTMGIAFVEFFFDDQHKLDYKILEAYYGLVGHSTNRYRNLEDQINSRSNFFHVDITGNIDKFTYIQALGDGSLLSDEYVVPMISPYKTQGDKKIETINIFDETPTSKYDDRYCYSLKTLYDRLVKTEYLNSAPFDYALFPGMSDIFCLEDKSEDYKTYDGLLPYKRSEFIVDPIDGYDSIDVVNPFNIISLNKFLSRLTNLGDKGIIAFLDIPEVVNQYFKENLNTCYSDSDTKDMVSKVEKFIPDLKMPLGGLYDRTYPLFNYQYVDKDFELTRYKKLDFGYERFELIPGSIMVLRAYLRNDIINNFYPIAGPRSVGSFPICHRCFIDKKDTNLFRVIYNSYGIVSLINDRDNNTFIVQQTTWNRSSSIFKQIHALRTYKALKRWILSILYQRIYEPNTLDNRKILKANLQSVLAKFKEAKLIDNVSDAYVWALTSDIENNQINCQVVVGIFGAIVKIVLNMNLTSATIDYTES